MFSNHQRDWLNARIEKQRINRENKIMTTSIDNSGVITPDQQ